VEPPTIAGAQRRHATVVRRVIPLDAGDLEIVEVGDPRAGPTLALIGGVHGDEDEGTLSVRRVLQRLAAAGVHGLVRAVAVANPAAYAAGSRCSPVDGLNLARVFPGAAAGAPSQRLARAITDEVITGADLLVDLHSAGRDFAMPLFCGYHDVDTATSRTAAAAAARFGVSLLWAHTAVSPGRTLSAAADLGVPAIYAEASGGGQVRGAETDAYVDGVLRLLCWMGMAGSGDGGVTARRMIHGGREDEHGSVTAPCTGTMVTRACAGQVVTAGCTIAEIYDDHGRRRAAVVADRDATIMKLRRAARVTAGAQVVVLAPPPVPWEPDAGGR
jgi:predicted deacylase